MHQTPFQRQLWLVALDAHACGDRSDARIMLRMIELIDDGDYSGIEQLAEAVRGKYRTRLGKTPSTPGGDGREAPDEGTEAGT